MSDESAATAAVSRTEKQFEVLDPSQRARLLAYTVYRSSMCVEEPKVVICVHGLTRNSHDFDYLAPTIAGLHQYVVYSVDVVGRGRSDYLTADSGEAYGYALYMKDMERFLHHLGIQTVDFWIGTSMGGLIGIHMCESFPGRIRNLILNDIGIVVPMEGVNRLAEYVGRNPAFFSIEEVVEYCKRTFKGYGDLPEDRWRHIASTSVFTCRELQQNVYRLVYDPQIGAGFAQPPTTDLDLGFLWEGVRCNVLLLRGENSDMLTEECAKTMADPELNQGKRNVDLVTVTGPGHAPALMTVDQIFLVIDWLRRH